MVSRGIETLRRIMWRLEEEHEGKEYILRADVEKAIMKESGIDPRTIKSKIDALVKLEWIKRDKKMYIINTEVDYD